MATQPPILQCVDGLPALSENSMIPVTIGLADLDTGEPDSDDSAVVAKDAVVVDTGADNTVVWGY